MTEKSEWSTIDSLSIEEGCQALAWWANDNPRPKKPEYIPGLLGVNQQLYEVYKNNLIAWKIGKAEAFMHGLKGQDDKR